jgi:hypothetical protein
LLNTFYCVLLFLPKQNASVPSQEDGTNALTFRKSLHWHRTQPPAVQSRSVRTARHR